ncbi:MAG: ribosome small subunit-dependent GTPase A [Methylococcaceae bacterium]|nr:ribosome small subunit-dependent GTPase A [Methylococcaceae bacterium]
MAGKDRRPIAPGPVATSEAKPGLVISHLGKGLAVEADDGRILLCHTRRRLGGIAVGDRVLWIPCEGDQGRVEEILPRRSLLARPGYGGKLRYVAANLDRVYVVIAPRPEPDWLLVDQYLAVCQHRGIAAEILLNKADLPESDGAVQKALDDYRHIGYPVETVSAKSGLGLDRLHRQLAEHCSMLAGQSGVGKSSLTNALLPERNLRIGEISAKSGLGRHTTTTATLYHVPSGGDLIDSPGVAVFGLAQIDERELPAGYREFQPFLDRCRFNDCRHVDDKGCAVRDATESGSVSAERYRRYLKLRERLVSGTEPDYD